MNFTLNIHYYFYAIYTDGRTHYTYKQQQPSYHHSFIIIFVYIFTVCSLLFHFFFFFLIFLYNFYKHSYCVCVVFCWCCFSAWCILDSHINSLNSHIFFIFMWESLLSLTLYTSTKIPAIYKVIHKFYPIIIFVNQENSETE